jgi:hypothetical protein
LLGLHGCRNAAQLAENAQAAQTRLSSDVVRALDDISQPLMDRLGDHIDMWQPLMDRLDGRIGMYMICPRKIASGDIFLLANFANAGGSGE